MPIPTLPSRNVNKKPVDSWQTLLAQSRDGLSKEPPKLHKLRSYSLAVTAITDAAIAAAFAKYSDNVAVLAVGSYGRREMLVYSDVDLLILTPETTPCGLEKVIAALWSSGLRIGHSVHTPASAAATMRTDVTVLTNLLHPRLVCGDAALMRQFMRAQRRMRTQTGTAALVDELFAHRDARHKRFGDSRFLLEPHLKDSKGALRDAQVLSWAAKLAFGVHDLMHAQPKMQWSKSTASHYKYAYAFLCTLRANLHHYYGRADERLVFGAQLHIAQRLGYKGKTPEQKAQRLMADYFKASSMIGECTRTLCTLLDRAHARTPPFSMADQPVLPNGLHWRDGRIFLDVTQPAFEQVVPMFALASKYSRDVHPDTIAWIQDHRDVLTHYFQHEPEAAVGLRDIMLALKPAEVLRRLHEAGVLRMIIPEFDHVHGQMQYDGYHTYTVDAHIMLVVDNIHALERAQFAMDAPVTTQAARDLVNRRALYVAALCHDLAKGTGGHHQEKGAHIAMRVAALLGLHAPECELAGWLVTHDQHLSDTAFKRDIDDPHIIAELVALVQSPERLRLLLVLTVADMRAVGPTIWNAWKVSVIRRLYERTMRAMGVTLSGALPERVGALNVISAAEHAALAKHSVVVDYAIHTAQAATEISVLALYEKGLLRCCAGVLASIASNIVAARTVMIDDSLCRMVFTVQNYRQEAYDDVGELSAIATSIQHYRAQPETLHAAVKKRRFVKLTSLHMPHGSDVFFDHQSSTSATVVEINAADRIGLLYDILGVFEAEHLHVASAYIATYGQKVVDVFYVKDRFGLPLRSAQALQNLRMLLQHLVIES